MPEPERCPHDPRELTGQPIGMYHCPVCGCMVIAATEHGPCIDEECPFYDEAFDRRMQAELRRLELGGG